METRLTLRPGQPGTRKLGKTTGTMDFTARISEVYARFADAQLGFSRGPAA